MFCPRCRVRLNRATTEKGVFFSCPKCNGRAVGMSLLRRTGSNESVRKLWVLARENPESHGADCPVCSRAMVEVGLPLRSSSPPLLLDVCAGCQFVWFDPREFELFPPLETDKPSPLPEKAREMIAVAEARMVADQAEKTDNDSQGPDNPWLWIPGLLGMPVEEDVPAVTCWPWLTYGLAAVLVLVYAMTAQNLDAVVDAFGLKPALSWRHGGITFVTSFFLHAGFWHLIGNVYFLVIFGDNVEDDLGWWKCALLIAISAFVGDLWHICGDPGSTAPCIGASGGISGIITYYALRFPRARLGLLMRFWFYFRWVHFPAYLALFFWFLLQFFYIFEQHLGIGNVAALAHLGGAAVGAVAWLLGRIGSPKEPDVV